jgi:transposase InsO family protein
LVGERPRFGYRRITALLRSEGWNINAKRIYRIWKKEGFKVPTRKRKKRARGSASNACMKLRSTRHNEVWAWDFVHDRLATGKPLRWLTLVDEFTRECLVLHPARSIGADQAADKLLGVIRQRGAPVHLRSDNGPEFVSQGLRERLAAAGVQSAYIKPGAPWQNGFAESFHARLRDELIDREEFGSYTEARVVADAWREAFNTRRPHSALDYEAPAVFAARHLARPPEPAKPTGRDAAPRASREKKGAEPSPETPSPIPSG